MKLFFDADVIFKVLEAPEVTKSYYRFFLNFLKQLLLILLENDCNKSIKNKFSRKNSSKWLILGNAVSMKVESGQG